MQVEQILAGLLGTCVADALGVPVEFTSREQRRRNPVDGLWGYGTWDQPPGTWSDDSSLMLCLAAAMAEGYALERIAQNFCRWYEAAFWTAHDQVFDVGTTTRAAIARLQQGVPPLQAGGTDEPSNGNGSLMRILPVAFYAPHLSLADLLHRTHQVSCLTHAHPRSQMACGLYISIATAVLAGYDLASAYQHGIAQASPYYDQAPFVTERSHFQRILAGDLASQPEATIQSGGYVVHTLEAALWCLLNSSSYAEAVLLAVNLGEDTDTTAAVTGGLAGLHYGLAQIPAEWLAGLAKRTEIEALAKQLAITLKNSVELL